MELLQETTTQNYGLFAFLEKDISDFGYISITSIHFQEGNDTRIHHLA